MVTPEELAAVRAAGRRQRRVNAAEFRRRALAGVIDVGDHTDAEVQQLYAAYRAGVDESAQATPTPPTPILP